MRWRLPSMSGSSNSGGGSGGGSSGGSGGEEESGRVAIIATAPSTSTSTTTATGTERGDSALPLAVLSTTSASHSADLPTDSDTHASATHLTVVHTTVMPATQVPAAASTMTDTGDAAEHAALVHKFDLSKYKDGKYTLVPASAREQIRYTGRFLHHGPAAKRKTKVNTVQFDWPGVEFEIAVRNTTTVAIRIKGDGNYFNVFVNGAFHCILKASLNAACCEVATDLEPSRAYTVTVTKRTEPQMRGALSTFKVCTFYGFIIESQAEVLPCRPPAQRKIEFVGDSVTCAFGNEGKATSAKTRFGLKGRMANVYNGYACIAARMLGAEAHVLAWSGKGVHSNAGDWGPNMPALWKNTIASRDGTWDMASWLPDVVVVNLGVNDLLPPASLETEVVSAYALFLMEVRQLRPQAHILCVAYDESCISAEDSETNRSHVAQQLQEIVRVAMDKVRKHDDRMHYAFLQIDGGLDESDYATLRHYAVSGHVKIAELLAAEIESHVQWRIEAPATTMPFPQEKQQILMPKDTSNCTIC